MADPSVVRLVRAGTLWRYLPLLRKLIPYGRRRVNRCSHLHSRSAIRAHVVDPGSKETNGVRPACTSAAGVTGTLIARAAFMKIVLCAFLSLVCGASASAAATHAAAARSVGRIGRTAVPPSATHRSSPSRSAGEMGIQVKSYGWPTATPTVRRSTGQRVGVRHYRSMSPQTVRAVRRAQKRPA